MFRLSSPHLLLALEQHRRHSSRSAEEEEGRRSFPAMDSFGGVDTATQRQQQQQTPTEEAGIGENCERQQMDDGQLIHKQSHSERRSSSSDETDTSSLLKLQRRLTLFQHAYINERAARQAYQRKFGETVTEEAPPVGDIDSMSRLIRTVIPKQVLMELKQDRRDNSTLLTASVSPTHHQQLQHSRLPHLATSTQVPPPSIPTPPIPFETANMAGANDGSSSEMSVRQQPTVVLQQQQQQPGALRQRAPAETWSKYQAARTQWFSDREKTTLERQQAMRDAQVSALAAKISATTCGLVPTKWLAVATPPSTSTPPPPQ